MRETTNLNWLAGFLNHQQYHLVSQQFKQCEHELEWINGLYHVVMRLSRINGTLWVWKVLNIYPMMRNVNIEGNQWLMSP